MPHLRQRRVRTKQVRLLTKALSGTRSPQEKLERSCSSVALVARHSPQAEPIRRCLRPGVARRQPKTRARFPRFVKDNQDADLGWHDQGTLPHRRVRHQCLVLLRRLASRHQARHSALHKQIDHVVLTRYHKRIVASARPAGRRSGIALCW